ncbi:MAG: hypothetical protein IKX30_15475 [Victivallales bacterium]|nr:hypothetical protein [Victivallales bacterium]MBR5080136.1 hypothetical protein [Victivallales bacterium]
MKNKHWMIVFLFVALATILPWSVFAEGGEEDELSGFALFEKLRAMKLEAQSAMVKEDYVEAAKIYRRMARYEKNRARSAAYLLRGADCLMQAKKGHRALEEYTNLLENYPLYVPYEHVVEQLRQLAEWFIVGDGTFLGIKDKDTGIQIYELIIREAPAVQVTLKDRLRLAELLEGSGRGEEAVVVYQAILRQEPGNWDVRAKLALLFLKLSKNGDGDGAKLRAAVREANIVLESNPDNPLAKDLKRLCRDAEAEEAERLLKNGQFYLLPAHRRPTAARRYMHDVIMKYPDSNAAKEARRLLKTNPELRALEEQNAKIDVVPPKTPSVKPQPAPSVKPQPAPSIVSKPVAAPKQDPRVAEREKAKKEAERLRQEKELKERQEAEKAKRLKEQEKERLEAEKRAEKLRKAEEAERQKAADKAAKLKAEREKEEARQHEKEEKARQKRLEEERKERQKQEQKRQENLRREAEKSAKERAKQEDEERSRIEKARQKAEGQLLETSGQAKPGNHVQLVVQDKKKQEESRREAEEELKRIRERNARMLKNDPKLLEEEQKRLKELMEKNRKR